jgi:hypothetical protein
MTNQIDTIMDTAWPKISAGITAAISADLKIDTFFPVDTLTDTKPYMATVTWAALYSDGETTLKRADVATVRSFELARSTTRSLDQLRDADDLKNEFQTWATGLRGTQLQLVAGRIGQSQESTFTLDNLKAASSDLAIPRRLIAPTDHEVSTAAKDAGLVDEVVAPAGILPTDVSAILLPLVAGPTVQPIVDDLTATWYSTGGDVKIVISSRFFIENPDNAHRFTAP